MSINEKNLKFIFGLKLGQMRRQAGKSLKELSEMSGISPSYLNEIEKGKKYPKADKIIALSNALDTPYDEMVSLKLKDELNPLADLLKSDALQEIPFELFGLNIADIMELMSGAPLKFSALIDTFIKIARSYDMRVEHLLFAAMRSYQEMNNNHFKDIEERVERFVSGHSEFKYKKISQSALAGYLIKTFGYEIIEEPFTEEQGLAGVRSAYVPGTKPKLILNSGLTEPQKNFILAKEIGYVTLQPGKRDSETTLMDSPSFDTLLSNFKSSYFAGALLMKRRAMVDELKLFFRKESWDGQALLDIMERFNATPEMFFYRLTQILPEYFGLNQIYFLRFHHHLPSDNFKLTKELHFSRLHQPHGVGLNEHYCRRWITLIMLNKLSENRKISRQNRLVTGAQKSTFYQTDNEYFCISIARPLMLTRDTDSCVTIGFVMGEKFKRKVRFWDDPAVESLVVNKTCERCGILDCKERVAEPAIYQKEEILRRGKESLKEIVSRYS